MHDPMTVAWEIRYPWGEAYPGAKRGGSFITIWHVDPERDGTDDSCGWFMRVRHGDKAALETIEKDFTFEWHQDYGSGPCGWFHQLTGHPIMSVQATALEMFRRAAYTHFGQDWRKTERFMKRNLYAILSFAENGTDSMRDSMVRYVEKRKDDRISSFAAMVYGWILRAEQPWYRHPRWHIHHWRFQVHPWQTVRRFLLTRCCRCGKRFPWGATVCTDQWDSPHPRFLRGEQGVYHADCRDIHSNGAAQAAA